VFMRAQLLSAVPMLIAADTPDCTWSAIKPREYTALKLDAPLILDGDLSKPAWQAVPWTEDFVDISTAVRPRLRTRAKLRWDERFLYVAAELQEPQLWATLKEHNSVIFNDNDFEIFVDANASNWHYKEFEMNAFDTNWDLMLSRPYGDGGYEISCRTDPAPCFDMKPPLASAVKLNGTINNPAGAPDVGWSVEVALPIEQLMSENADSAQKPRAGIFWRINFSRVQWALAVNGSEYVKMPSCQSCPIPGEAHEDNWVWSPQGVIAMHQPETWAIVQFVEAGAPLVTYDEWPSRALARALYNAQHAYSDATSNGDSKQFTDSLTILDQYANPPGVLHACARGDVRIHLSPDATNFTASMASVAGPEDMRAQITDERYATVTQRSSLHKRSQ